LSRVFVGGGAEGEMDDFVELRNRGAGPIDLSGWTLQYASSQGSNWTLTQLSGTIAPNRAFVVAAAALNPDWTARMQFAVGSGKLALVRSTARLQGPCPVDSAELVDLLGYGSTSCSLGSPTPAGTAGAEFVRSNDGCADTRNNAADFSAVDATMPDRDRPVEPCAVN
jgi:uncharacterized protein